MTSRRRSTLSLLACAGVASLMVAGCGGADSSGSQSTASSGGKTLTVYVSLPSKGAGKTRSGKILLGAKTPPRKPQNTAGKFKIKLATLDASTAQGGQWD